MFFNDFLRGTIQEEVYSKSLPDREKWGTRGHGTPLLPKLTPKAQIRRMQHPQAASLLSSSSSESDDDYNEMKADI